MNRGSFGPKFIVHIWRPVWSNLLGLSSSFESILQKLDSMPCPESTTAKWGNIFWNELQKASVTYDWAWREPASCPPLDSILYFCAEGSLSLFLFETALFQLYTALTSCIPGLPWFPVTWKNTKYSGERWISKRLFFPTSIGVFVRWHWFPV